MSCVRHLHRELGFQAVEVNASDTRNKADASAAKGMGGKLANGLAEMCNNTAYTTQAADKPRVSWLGPPHACCQGESRGSAALLSASKAV